jgi:hypothetical protein
MAYIPEKLSNTETLLNNYDLSTGVTSSISSDISDYNKISVHFTYTAVDGSNIFRLQQSNDNINWSNLSEEYQIPISSGNFMIDKSQFTSKYVKIDISSVGSGNLSATLVVKR